jgi:hypothetical protein
MYCNDTGQIYIITSDTAFNQNWSMCVTMKNPFSGTWCRVILVWTDVSDYRISSIFRVEESASEKPAWASSCRLSCPLKRSLYSWSFQLTAQSTATCSRWFLALRFFYPEDESNTILREVGSQKTTLRHIPENGFLHFYNCLESRNICGGNKIAYIKHVSSFFLRFTQTFLL